jgi:CheY-like chemotaxis protein
MRLESLTPELLRRAIAIYLREAWPDPAGPRPRTTEKDFESVVDLGAMLARFERPREKQRPALERYTLRLGNARYPFMKLVVQEYLVDREYFLSVDTHDDLEVGPDSPDWNAWQEIKDHNLALKRRIEAAWAKEGLPTHSDLRRLALDIAGAEREASKKARLLVVDDESEVCEGVGALLRSKGYEVECYFDGQTVWDRLQQEPLPDLLLLDYAMPRLGGDEVLRRVRADARLSHLPVLLATASSIDLERVPRASGLLRKPYPREVLFALLGQMLERRARPAGT